MAFNFFNLKSLVYWRHIQAKLDATIAKETNYSSEFFKYHHILAFIIEVAELANEIKSFKHWQINKNIDNNKIIAEFVDVLHFYLSLCEHFKLDNFSIIRGCQLFKFVDTYAFYIISTEDVDKDVYISILISEIMKQGFFYYKNTFLIIKMMLNVIYIKS